MLTNDGFVSKLYEVYTKIFKKFDKHSRIIISRRPTNSKFSYNQHFEEIFLWCSWCCSIISVVLWSRHSNNSNKTWKFYSIWKPDELIDFPIFKRHVNSQYFFVKVGWKIWKCQYWTLNITCDMELIMKSFRTEMSSNPSNTQK